MAVLCLSSIKWTIWPLKKQPCTKINETTHKTHLKTVPSLSSPTLNHLQIKFNLWNYWIPAENWYISCYRLSELLFGVIFLQHFGCLEATLQVSGNILWRSTGYLNPGFHRRTVANFNKWITPYYSVCKLKTNILHSMEKINDLVTLAQLWLYPFNPTPMLNFT